MKWDYISAQKLERERSKSFAVCISLRTKDIRSSVRVPGTGKYPQAPGNPAEAGQNHDARKTVSATLCVLERSGAIFRPTSSKLRVQKVLLCPFHWKPRQSGISLKSPRLENIPQVPGNRAEVGQNYHARKAVLASLSVLK